jgi:lysozyme
MSELPSKKIALLALPLLLLQLSACGAGPAFPPQKLVGERAGHYKATEATRLASRFAVHGVDVSKYQGNVDWTKVHDAGIKFAYIKATEGGDRIDPKFFRNWYGAKAAGMPRGAYHFVYWCRPWREEMAWFERTVPPDPSALPPVLDVEATPDSPTCKRHLQREETLREIKGMLQEMQRYYGKRPMIYTTVDFYQAILEGALENYPIWIRSTKHRPSVKYGDRNWEFWQYQSDALVRGIPTRVDRNAFYGNAREWHSWLRRNGFDQTEARN